MIKAARTKKEVTVASVSKDIVSYQTVSVLVS